MTGSRPDLVIVRALKDEAITPGFAEIRGTLDRAGVNTIPVNYYPADGQPSEYPLAVSGPDRRQMNAFVETHRELVEGADGLIVVNSATETVLGPPPDKPEEDREEICKIPFSVGYVAAKMISLATEMYGPGSGRVFLSHRYPDLTELFSVVSKRRSVTAARARLLGLYPLGPVALGGDMDKAAEMAKTRER